MLVSHYMRRAPESEQTRETVKREPFVMAHLHEALNTNPGPFADRYWPSTPQPIERNLALELVNKWNRSAEHFRYWLEA